MFISVSLSGIQKRKVASKKPFSASNQRRVSKDEFIKFSPHKQKAYLKKYPQSSHRFLIKKKKGKVEVSPEPIRKVSRATYDEMNKKEQKAYDRVHKGEKKFRGKKHIAARKANPLLEKFRKQAANPKVRVNKLEALAAAEKKVQDTQRERYSSELKGAINPEAMEAIRTITPEHLSEAADNLQANKTKVLAEFEEKLERDRLDATELSDEDRSDLEKVVAGGKDPNNDELDEIIKTKKPTRKQKKVAEEALERKPRNFFQRDMDNLGAIIRGEKVDNKGKSNFITALSILGRYALVAGGVAAIALGGAPMAIYIAKEIFDNWKAIASNDDENEFTVDHAYDAIVDHLRNVDLEVLGGLSRKPKFVSTSSDKVSRISYRCLPEERMLPFVKRTAHRVMFNGDQIGEIRASATPLASPNVRIWEAHITGGFDPLDFPHVDDPESMKEPYVLTNDDSSVEHNLELHCPLLMTLQEARNWVCQIVEK